VNVILNKVGNPGSQNSSGNFNISCQQCELQLVETFEEGNPILKCPKCGFKEYSFTEVAEEDEGSVTLGAVTETKRKPGGGSKFIEVMDAIQGKLDIKPKDKNLVENAIKEAKKHFKNTIVSYDVFNKWFRDKHFKSNSNVDGIKKYPAIYKHGPYIYSSYTGIELASVTDTEFSKIEAAYSLIALKFRSIHFEKMSGKSNKSIKPEFYIEKLIEMYVKDIRRQKALKSVISSKADDSNSVHDAVWSTMKSQIFKK
jgi:hypothetical protein